MEREEIEEICGDRLAGWQKKLVEEQKGQTVVVTTEEMSNQEIVYFLAETLRIARHSL